MFSPLGLMSFLCFSCENDDGYALKRRIFFCQNNDGRSVVGSVIAAQVAALAAVATTKNVEISLLLQFYFVVLCSRKAYL